MLMMCVHTQMTTRSFHKAAFTSPAAILSKPHQAISCSKAAWHCACFATSALATAAGALRQHAQDSTQRLMKEVAYVCNNFVLSLTCMSLPCVSSVSFVCHAAAAAAAISKPAARPSSFLQAAGGSTAPDGNRGPAGNPPPGRGGAGPPGGGRGRGRAPPRAPPVSVPNEDFNFEEMMKKFNKQALLKVGMHVHVNVHHQIVGLCVTPAVICVYAGLHP